MMLQELLFPNYDTCACYEMYFRLDGKGEAAVDAALDMKRREVVYYDELFLHRANIRYDNTANQRAYYDPQERAVHLSSWQPMGFDTYFNSFSIAKWLKYTRLDNLKLRLELKGGFQVSVMHMYSMYTEPFENVFCEQICRSEERRAFEIDIPLEAWDRGIIAFRLHALEGEDNVFYGGGYVTEVDEAALNPVDIAVDICTYRRERFVEKNIEMLRRGIIDNPRCPVSGHLEVFIADNGKTLDINRLQSPGVHIYPNKNLGGAGGFARGMIEILDMKEKRPFSHVLVMDDDVLINTDAIVRTYRLLQFMKPEYSGKTIAGAMLRLDNRSIQHECTALWTGLSVQPYKTMLDLKDIENILFNENEALPNYNAWWYSCIPISKISNECLPMPIFFRYDDVEFGLRSGSDVLAMNGICLWHEPFEYKYSSVSHYYEMRNMMIVNALHCPGFGLKQAMEILRYVVKVNTGRYRYGECEMAFRAIEDYCKGPEFLMNTDGEALHREIMGIADKLLPLDQLSVRFDEIKYLKSMQKEPKGKKILRFLTLNKNLWPRGGSSIVDAALNGVKDYAGKKQVLNYSVSNHRGFVSEHSFKRLVSTMRGMNRTKRLLKQKFAETGEAYRQAAPRLMSRAFWDEYLELK